MFEFFSKYFFCKSHNSETGYFILFRFSSSSSSSSFSVG